MYNNLIDCYQGFYHGPIVSKIWLCETLETILNDLRIEKPTVKILGCWQNVLAFMMQVRKPNYYNQIDGYDLDKLSIEASNRICDAWNYEPSKVFNHNIDFCSLDFKYDPNTIFVNCSVDQFKDTTWFDRIPNKSLLVMQSTDITDINPPWEITQSYESTEKLLDQYKLNKILFTGKKPIVYTNLKYNRLMVIGIK